MCHVLLARNKAQSPALYLKQALLVVYRLSVVRQHLSVQWSQLTQRYIRKLSVYFTVASKETLFLQRPPLYAKQNKYGADTMALLDSDQLG